MTLVEDEDVIAKMAYTLANPVEARLVGHADEWDGATSAGMQFGGRRWIARPQKFFSEGMPEVVELRLTRPACFAELSDRELMDSLRGLVEGTEAEARKQGRAIGMAAVRRQEVVVESVDEAAAAGLDADDCGEEQVGEDRGVAGGEGLVDRVSSGVGRVRGWGARRGVSGGDMEDGRRAWVRGCDRVSAGTRVFVSAFGLASRRGCRDSSSVIEEFAVAVERFRCGSGRGGERAGIQQ